MTKSLEYYLQLKYAESVRPFIGGDDEENFFLAEIVDLPGCVVGASERREALVLLEKAREAYITSRYEKGLDIPLPRDGEWTIHDAYATVTTTEASGVEEEAQACTTATDCFELLGYDSESQLQVDSGTTDGTYTEDRLVAVG